MTHPGMTKADRNLAMRLTLVFLLSSAVWIIATDQFVGWLFHDSMHHALAQTIKGLLYILVTSGLVYWLSSKALADAAAQKEAETALNKSESRYLLLADHTLDIIWAMTPDLIFTYVNPAIETVLGYKPSEYVGTHLQQHLGATTFNRLTQIIQAEISRGAHAGGVAIEIDILSKDGSTVAVEVHGKVIFDNNGVPVAIQGTTRDIRERRAMEAELRQSQKLQAIGTLAGGIAHEMNNPIMGISGYAEIIAADAGKDSEIPSYCTEIQKQTERLHGLIHDLLGYARTDEKEFPKAIHLGTLVESTLSLVRTVIRHDQILMSVDIPDDLPMAKCRCQQIQQVVINLVTNARDTLNEKYPDADENKRILISGQAIEKNRQPWVRLSIEDQGTGLSDDVRQRIFEPFFTTKPEGKGTGLGMWIVYRIIQDHAGQISIETEPGICTRFNIDLPAEPAFDSQMWCLDQISASMPPSAHGSISDNRTDERVSRRC